MADTPMPRLRTPIVMVPGLFGFNRVKVAGKTLLNYFPGISEALEKAGNRVHIPFLPPTGGITERAQKLKEFIQDVSPNEPVHILAHSMGGLDSRYMISCLGMDQAVLSLTTIGTPHLGTSFADWGVQRLERLVKPVFEFMGMPTQAFYDLTRPMCQSFNEKVVDRPTVRYFSVAGRFNGNVMQPEWLIPYHVVLTREGPNDGVVSIESARYGESEEIWDADHLHLVNWKSLNFAPSVVPLYAKLIQRLADIGF